MWDLGQLFVYLLVFIFGCPVVPVPFIERTTTIFLHWTAFAPLLIISWAYLCRLTPGFSVLFHWSIHMFLYQYHTVLTSVALSYCLKSERAFWFFFLRIAVATLGLLWFHINFSIIYSNSVWNVMGNFTGITLNL